MRRSTLNIIEIYISSVHVNEHRFSHAQIDHGDSARPIHVYPMSSSPSPSTALQLIPLSLQDERDSLWRRIYTGSNAVVLYNPTSHALAVQNDVGERELPSDQGQLETDICPYCRQRIPLNPSDGTSSGQTSFTRAPNYFHLLSLANEASSRPPSRAPTPEQNTSTFPTESIAQGYFSTFFKEEYRLGMGANGSVYLCQVGRLSL